MAQVNSVELILICGHVHLYMDLQRNVSSLMNINLQVSKIDRDLVVFLCVL